MSWLKTTVSAYSPASRAVGPEPPTRSTIRVAIMAPAPDLVIAVDIGIIPPTSRTVVHEMLE